MANPFAMSFDEIKAQADANMRADKGQGAKAPQTQPQAETQAAPKPERAQAKPAGGKSFLEIVEETQRQLAQEDGQAKEEPKEEQQKEAPAPGISFDNVTQQAESPMEPMPSFDDMFAQAEGKDTGAVPSFDDMFAQAEGANTGAVPSFDDMFAKAGQPAGEPKASGISFGNVDMQGKEQPQSLLFDEMVAQAQAQTKAEEPVKGEAKPEEEPVKEETKAEEPVKEEAKAEEPVKEETKAEEPVKEEAKSEKEPVKAPAKKPAGKKSGTKKKEEEEKEPLPDTTDDYKVDLGQVSAAQPAKEEKPAKKEAPREQPVKEAVAAQASPLSMDNIFTPEEIAAFRADIRTIVAQEFKAALVGVTKDFLKSLGDVKNNG